MISGKARLFAKLRLGDIPAIERGLHVRCYRRRGSKELAVGTYHHQPTVPRSITKRSEAHAQAANTVELGHQARGLGWSRNTSTDATITKDDDSEDELITSSPEGNHVHARHSERP